MSKPAINPVYGIVAEFSDGESLLKAANKVREAGYTATDAFSPVPVHGIVEALGIRKSRMAALIFCGGLTGALTGLLFQTWVSVGAYPHVVSGRPLFSWPSFVPVIFEATVLFSAFCAVFGMLIRNRLPEPYHPVFNTPEFSKASTDGYFISIESSDPKYNSNAIKSLLSGTGARRVTEVSRHADDIEQ